MTEMAALMQGPPGPPGRGRPGRPGSPGPQGRPGTPPREKGCQPPLPASYNLLTIEHTILDRRETTVGFWIWD